MSCFLLLFERWKQYAKSGSLTPHNVVMALVGDDFRFDYEIEWDQQYINYQNLFNYINANGRVFNDTRVAFGTVSDYFDAVRERMADAFPTLQGDFFPYADIFSEGRPAYWTGYFTSRAFYKVPLLWEKYTSYFNPPWIVIVLKLSNQWLNQSC